MHYPGNNIHKKTKRKQNLYHIFNVIIWMNSPDMKYPGNNIYKNSLEEEQA